MRAFGDPDLPLVGQVRAALGGGRATLPRQRRARWADPQDVPCYEGSSAVPTETSKGECGGTAEVLGYIDTAAHRDSET